MLRDIAWEPVYESRFEEAETLLDRFYRPLLAETRQYDRLAGYLSLRSLAHALDGVESMLSSEGTIRVIAGAELQVSEKGALLPDADEPLSPRVKSQLAIIGTLMERGNVQIKVGDTADSAGIFHAKLGIATDWAGESVSFEGSVNETRQAWEQNFERFKVHRSWEASEDRYVTRDKETFESLWTDSHPSVDVYDLPEADRENLLEWTEYGGTLDEHVERVQSTPPVPDIDEGDTARVVAAAGQTPGGLHLAEDISTITPWPHQRTIADTAVSIYPNNLLFCDEVGLGKTIEAGLTVSRLIQTGGAKTALFLVPAGLVQQWQDELYSLFNIHAYRRESSHNGEYLRGPSATGDTLSIPASSNGSWGESPFGRVVDQRDEPLVVVESWHTARLDQNQHVVAPDVDDTVWDVTVVDEAHSASEGTKFYDLLTDVEATSACLYALTATPMELDVGDLHDLLRLCDIPSKWDDKERFREFYDTRQAFESALTQVTTTGGQQDHIERDLLNQFKAEIGVIGSEGRKRIGRFAEMLMSHLQAHDGYDDRAEQAVEEASPSIRSRRALEKLLGVRDAGPFDDPKSLVFECDIGGWEQLVAAAEWGTPVQTRIARNTRTVLEQCEEIGLEVGNIPSREVETKRIPLGDLKPLYERIEEYITETYKESQRVLTGNEQLALGFVMTLYQQRLTSSLYAIRQSLERRQSKIDTELADMTDRLAELSQDDSVSEATLNEVLGPNQVDAYQPQSGQGMSVIQSEKETLDTFVSDLHQLTTDPKMDQLTADIQTLQRQGRDRILIFTQYQDTLEFIRDTLTGSHTEVGSYSGSGGKQYDRETGEWVAVGKEVITQEFKDGNVSILVCTDSASEGLNLQNADALVNFGLPWNPMTVEQRIGRIDRIGQENDVVKIINYAYEDSVDGDIYEALEERLSLFEDVVGDMRPVLTTLEDDIRDVAMTAATLGDEHESTNVVDEAETRATSIEEKVAAAGLSTSTDSEITEQNIIDQAGVSGWGNVHHPAIADIGTGEQEFSPVVTPELVEQLFTQSTVLEEAGWTFTSLRNHEQAVQFTKIDAREYVLSPPAHEDVVNRTVEKKTVQSSLQGTDTIVVTFDPAIADTFPSVRLLLPGDPLYVRLRDIILDETSSSIHYVGGEADESSSITVTADALSTDAYDVVLPVAAETSETTLITGDELSTSTDAEVAVSTWIQQY